MDQKLIYRLLVSIMLILIMAQSNDQNRYLGLILPAGSQPLGPDRWQSSKSYGDTKKNFDEQLRYQPQIKLWGEEINLPHVRSVSYKNFDPQASWSFINIYLNVQKGITEIFFITSKVSNITER